MTLQQLKYVITISQSGSMNEAAKRLFISQPSLSESVKDLEGELGFDIFIRSNRGIVITPQGKEFLGYAKQVTEQYNLLSDRYFNKKMKQHFSVSLQHYTFAVKAFVEVIKQFGMDEYEFAIYETRTDEIIQDVRNFKSELGVMFVSDFNRKILNKIFAENSLEFVPMFDCNTYVYLAGNHPLAGNSSISMEELEPYPCLVFEQGDNSLFLSEEVMSTYEYKRMIKANDRATLLNLMIGAQGYTLCSGIICEELNGSQYAAVPLEDNEIMTIGYIKRKNAGLSTMGQLYVEELAKYKDNVLKP